MLAISCDFKAAQPFRGFGRFAAPVGCKLVSFMLLVITLLLPQVVCAQSQNESNDAEPSTIFGIAETAPVVVNGKVRFHVVGVTAYPAEPKVVPKERWYTPPAIEPGNVSGA